MKTTIHPEVIASKIVCSCGEEFPVSSTLKEEITRIEICSKCHPFYTWEQRILKTGSVDKFYARMKKTENLKK